VVKPVITVHAIRWFAERVLGIRGLPDDDVEAVAALRAVHKVSTADLERVLEQLVERGVTAGASAVLFAGTRYILKGPYLITVLNIRRQPRFSHPIERDGD